MSTSTIRRPLDYETPCRPAPQKETIGRTERMARIGIVTAGAVPDSHLPGHEQMRGSPAEHTPGADILDEALEQTFPASDAVAVVLPGHG